MFERQINFALKDETEQIYKMIDECLDKNIYYNFMDEFLDFKSSTVNLIDF